MNSIHAQLEKAEMMEAQARYLEHKGFRELYDLGCGSEWGEENCEKCDCRALCSSEYAAYRLHIEHLLNDSKAGYEQCAQLLRKLVSAEPSEERIELLARALLDLDVHVYSQDKPAEELFWEVQYWYLQKPFLPDTVRQWVRNSQRPYRLLRYRPTHPVLQSHALPKFYCYNRMR